jgi:hypothetical protein
MSRPSVVTLTTSSPHGFRIGDSITISGLAGMQQKLNVVVNGIADQTSFTYRPMTGWDWLRYHWREFYFDLREKYHQAIDELREIFRGEF